MGLAPYGNPKSNQTKKYIDIIKRYLVDVKDDGSIWLNQKIFNYATGLKMINEKNGLIYLVSKKEMNKITEQHHCDLALAIQTITEKLF